VYTIVFSSMYVKAAGNRRELIGDTLVVSIQNHILQSVTCIMSHNTPALNQ